MTDKKRTICYDSLSCLSRNDTSIIFNNKNNIIPSEVFYSVEMQSLEIVLGFSNLRDSNQSTTMSFSMNSILYTIVITQGQYFDIASLLLEINTKLSNLLGPGIINISINASNANMLQVTCNASVLSLVFLDGILNTTILGLTSITPSSLSIKKCNKIYNLNPDTYISMNINEISVSNIYNNKNIKGIYKIPCINSYAQEMFFSNSYFTNTYRNTTALDINNQITFQFYDRFGFIIPMTYMDFSVSLVFSV